MNQEIPLFWFLSSPPLLVYPKTQFLDFFHPVPELTVLVVQSHGFKRHLFPDLPNVQL